jgi:hypothetical protein
MLSDGMFYQDLGAQIETPHAQARKLAERISKLGFNCSITPKAEEEAVSV